MEIKKEAPLAHGTPNNGPVKSARNASEREDSPVIAESAGFGNIAKSSPESNLAQFREYVNTQVCIVILEEVSLWNRTIMNI